MELKKCIRKAVRAKIAEGGVSVDQVIEVKNDQDETLGNVTIKSLDQEGDLFLRSKDIDIQANFSFTTLKLDKLELAGNFVHE